jgi:Effector Associated Constant Component 1
MAGQEGRASPGDGVVRLRITPLSDFFDENDPRHASEAFELQRALKREGVEGLQARPAPGEKGVLTDIIVDVATGGAITGLIEVFKIWLAARPVNRKLELEFEVEERKGKRTGTLHIDASNIDSDSLAEITSEAFRPKG